MTPSACARRTTVRRRHAVRRDLAPRARIHRHRHISGETGHSLAARLSDGRFATEGIYYTMVCMKRLQWHHSYP
ncbi:hypothetical protein MIZ01_2243 [Sideroxyarcus emersonii]|uniref:Uncharacterized protein n=1 Tax=Sideroxyarcus emersonii TaxID=2764705 RepID=A0AAN1XC34_9PROT|nr:hypothetical protein MIZ01_2243 [Sideroxyarcus emersonii]